MYQVLYRKWRPKIFDDVYGQPQVTMTLLSELKGNKLAHAYLFTGTRGTGKTTCAKILAKAVNCLHPIDGNPCNECEVCRGIEDESITDVIEMDAASNNGVDDIRMLRDKVNFTPSVCKYLVYIIDEVHMLSTAAFNALLKTLEEPPPYVMFILATTEEHKIPATILSRCQKLNFKRIAPEDIAERLKYIAGEEGALLEDDAATLIARLADGGMRDAISLLDQCLVRDREVTEDVVIAAAGMAGTDHLFELSRLISCGDCAGIIEYIATLYSEAKDLYRVCEELINHFRSLMIINSVQKPEAVLTVSTAELKRLTEDAQRYSLPQTLNIIDSLNTALERMSRGASRRAELEMCLIRISRDLQKSDSGDLAARITALEKQIRSGVFMKQASPDDMPQAKPAASPALPKLQVQELSDRATPYEEWTRVLSLLEERHESAIFAALSGSRAYVSDDYLLVDCNDFGAEMLRQPRVKNNLRSIIAEVSGKQYRLGPYRPSIGGMTPENSAGNALIERLKLNGIESQD